MVLITAFQFTFDFVARASCTISDRASTLDNKVWNHPVKSQTIIKSFVCKINEILNRSRGIFFVKLHLHGTFFGNYFSCFHFFKIQAYRIICLCSAKIEDDPIFLRILGEKDRKTLPFSIHLRASFENLLSSKVLKLGKVLHKGLDKFFGLSIIGIWIGPS